MPPAVSTSCVNLQRLLRYDTHYMQAVVEGRPTVSVLVAATDTTVVAARVEQLAGRTDYREPRVGYLRATVPTTAVSALACGELVDAFEVDGPIGIDDVTAPSRSFGRTFELDHPWVREAAPVVRPTAVSMHAPHLTFPLDEMGIDRFLGDHPTYDGRGVTIAMVEWMPDLIDAGLWSSTTARTNILRPAFDWPNAPNQYLIPLQAVMVVDGYVRIAGRSYRVPGALNDRPVKVGVVDERRFPYYGGDLNRDDNPLGAGPFLGVLRDAETHRVWVDVTLNRDFADEEGFQCGREPVLTLGRDDPATARRESIGALLLCEDARDTDVLFIPTAHRHSTALAAAAVGARFARGGHGVAPGAALLPVLRFSGSTSAFIESLLCAFRDPRIDLITTQYNAARRVRDGRSVPSMVADRAVRHFDKLLFSSVGNQPPGLETVSDTAAAGASIGVGLYVSPRTLAATHGIRGLDAELPVVGGTHGPRADGQLKPDLLASGVAYLPTSTAWPEPSSDPRYAAGWGTSLAAPAAAASAALLLSAARQEHLETSASVLKAALLFSARHLSAYSVTQQGAGLISVPAAWEALRRGVRARELDVRAPVATTLTADGDVAPWGPGLFEREGWSAADIGSTRTRTVTLTRRGGPLTAERFLVTVLGDASTYDVPTSVVLPRDIPVKMRVRITPRRTGSHEALVRLADAATGRARAQVPLTVIVVGEVPASTAQALQFRGEVAFPQFRRHFVRVPEGLTAVRFDLSTDTGSVLPLLSNPAGMPFALTAAFQERAWHYTLLRPEPGVWQVVLANAQGATFGLGQEEERTSVSYTLTIRAGPASAGATSASIPATTLTGPLTAETPFLMEDFYVPHDGTTLALRSDVAQQAACAAHRLVLEHCEHGSCSPALGSLETNAGTILQAPRVRSGVWRAIAWRTTPASCRQHIIVDVYTSQDGPRDTARRSP